jgi:glutathione S-transferase
MSLHLPITPDTEHGARLHELARLRAALTLIECMAGEIPAPAPTAGDDEAAARIYAAAHPLVRRRYDALAGETATFAAAGLAALIRRKDRAGDDPAPAAARLAAEMRAAIAMLERIIEG